jgi:hypothetical protein
MPKHLDIQVFGMRDSRDRDAIPAIRLARQVPRPIESPGWFVTRSRDERFSFEHA